MRELQDLLDMFPYCLLVALPLMIALSPAAEAVGHEFPAHRLAQFELAGIPRGPKTAAVSMDARAVPQNAANVNLLRKMVVAKLQDMSVTTLNELVSSGAGGILLLVPQTRSSKNATESLQTLEEHLQTTELEIPIYFSEETEQLNDLLESLKGQEGGQSTSAAQTLFNSLSSNGYQLVSASSAVPKAMSDPSMVSVEANLRGSVGNDNEAQPTVVLVAHHDASGTTPSLSYGVDSNGSGVTVVMELARLFGKLYSSPRTRPAFGLVFLLSSGGKLNYFGTKKWLEEHLDHDANSELLADVAFVSCLDTIAGDKMVMHVSKPPKEDTHSYKFLMNLKAEMVHKKINLADDLLAWEHERFSIRRLPAFTVSRMSNPSGTDRSSIVDTQVDHEVVYKQVKNIGEALACTLYNYASEGCSGHVFSGSLSPSKQSVDTWLQHMSTTPRFASITASKTDFFVQGLADAMKAYVGSNNVRLVQSKREAREPEFVLYDSASTILTAYRVKPAVFDLVLTLCIGAYLSLVYVVIAKCGAIVSFVSSLNISSTKMNGSLNNGHSNGHHKVK